MGGMSIGNLPNQSILTKINDIAADVNGLDLEGVNNLKNKLSNLVAPELGNSDEKAISQKVVTTNIQQLNTEVNNKINKVESAQNGNLPSFDNGNIKDSKIPSDNIAQQNGYYEGMVVGASRSLAGDNEVRAEYVFRPSGGTDIQSGTASINRVLGKTLVWNQLFFFVKNYVINNYHIYEGEKQLMLNHKILVKFKYDNIGNAVTNRIGLCKGGNTYGEMRYDYTFEQGNDISFAEILINKNKDNRDIFYEDSSNSVSIQSDTIQLFDLTQMFGKGNEPTTVEEFEAMFPNDYYEYNEGTLISNDAVGIKSVGFNAWDEEWELGVINTTTGNLTNSSGQIRSKNYVKVIPNTSYYNSATKGSGIWCLFYDKNKNIIVSPNVQTSTTTSSNAVLLKNKKFITPQNAQFMKFYLTNDYGATYNNDICINLSHSGIRDGEYKPYEEHKLLFNKGGKLSAIKGKLNGEGESVVVFPDGLRSTGNARDEIVGNVAIKRIGAVDMGTLNWRYDDGSIKPSSYPYGFFTVDINDAKMINPICVKYQIMREVFTDDKTIFPNSGNRRQLYIVDSSYTDPTTFKQSLQGQILYYELKKPETYILDEAIPMNYVVDDWGTEQRLVADENEVLAPLCYDVTYAINAVDTIRNMPKNYISEETMQAFLLAVGSAMGGTWNMTWNEDMQKYVFTFAPNAVATDVE